MNRILMASLLMLVVVLSGCVTTRGLVTLADPKVTAQPENLNKTAIIKIVEDHSACRHLALVVGKDRPMRWIPATASMEGRLWFFFMVFLK